MNKIVNALLSQGKTTPVRPKKMQVYFDPVPEAVRSMHAKGYADKLGLQPTERVVFATRFCTGVGIKALDLLFARGFMITDKAIYARLYRPVPLITPQYLPPRKIRIPLESIQSLKFEVGLMWDMMLALLVNGVNQGYFIVPVPGKELVKSTADRETPTNEALAFFNSIVR